MFSEALRILDDNTAQYMVDEMKKEIQEKDELIDALMNEKNATINAKDMVISKKNAEIAKNEAEIAKKNAEIATLKAMLAERAN